MNNANHPETGFLAKGQLKKVNRIFIKQSGHQNVTNGLIEPNLSINRPNGKTE